ncbi:MAG: hypothetical protein DRJ41_04530 [Thermoprotei archaeon]|nr:MAG: hypothetical protein DRJ41_04530 [Thermoprotei archaeon]
MSILSRLFKNKNPLESLTLDDLKRMKIKLEVRMEELSRRIGEIEDEVKKLFEKAKETKSHSEEVFLARRIKALTQEANVLRQSHSSINKELVLVTNLLGIKQHEAFLREAGVWNVLKNVKPELLVRYLAERKVEAEDRERLLNELIDLSSQMWSTEAEEGDVKEILEALRAVKEGQLEPEEASKTLVEGKREKEEELDVES